MEYRVEGDVMNCVVLKRTVLKSSMLRPLYIVSGTSVAASKVRLSGPNLRLLILGVVELVRQNRKKKICK